ncbi:hypothetical protein EDD18DRAFT_1466819 [Armillaria luteobubalina]|uniref:Uncharacterized protein n=1 Tax=Armillaria luteobubalina TaxID=153913 RepID=A0AA39PMC0_9AGAR|nr:hypothetical protein EDD18DRAFT_1466819 [Armillaria luteobubalina]
MDENLLPILQLSPQLVSLCFKDKLWSGDSVPTMESLIIKMTEAIHVGDSLHHMLIPCLEHLEIVLQNIEFDIINYLDVSFVEMVVSRRDSPASQMLESLRIVVEGRDFTVPFNNNSGLNELKRLGEGGLHLHLDLYGWDQQVLQAKRLPFDLDLY